MSDTPRTDAQTRDGQYREWDGSTITLHSWDYVPFDDGSGDVVYSDFARELECELNAVTAERDELQERLEQMELRLAAVTKERDAILPDWMRLGGWLPKHWHIAKDVSGEVGL
jgi:hypothetical protein